MKKQLRSFGKTLLYSVMGGMCIALGGAGFLSVESKVLGALLFSVGLFTILTFGYHLYTGKVCYILEKNRRFALGVPVIWVGNLIGCWLSAVAFRNTRIGEPLAEKARVLCEIKLADDLLSMFILAIFCNFLIYIAVDGYNNSRLELGKYLSVFFGVVVFIVDGFEHCVANMFYFSMADMWTAEAWVALLVVTVGNAVGGIGIRLLNHWRRDRLTE